MIYIHPDVVAAIGIGPSARARLERIACIRIAASGVDATLAVGPVAAASSTERIGSPQHGLTAREIDQWLVDLGEAVARHAGDDARAACIAMGAPTPEWVAAAIETAAQNERTRQSAAQSGTVSDATRRRRDRE
jgi:4-hydroxy-3-methylbut-2-enyl diphosphate reductase IspH